jgi:hypothetical protein
MKRLTFGTWNTLHQNLQPIHPKTAKQSFQDLERGWVWVLLEAHNGVIFHDLGCNMDNHQFQHFVSSLLEY